MHDYLVGLIAINDKGNKSSLKWVNSKVNDRTLESVTYITNAPKNKYEFTAQLQYSTEYCNL
jgi:hypothetical protein